MKQEPYAILQNARNIIRDDDSDFSLHINIKLNLAQNIDSVLIEFSDGNTTIQYNANLSSDSKDIYYRDLPNVIKDLVETSKNRAIEHFKKNQEENKIIKEVSYESNRED